MRSVKQRRFPLSRIFGGLMLAAESKRRSSRHSSPLNHLFELESRILMAGNPSQLLYVAQPSQVAALSTMYPAITIKIADSTGAQTTDTSKVTLRITQGPNGATINNATAVSVSAVSGLATFDGLTFNLPGTYKLIATDGNLTSATSTSFTVTTAANHLNFQHTISSLTAGDTFSTSIEIDDANGLGHPVTTDRSTVTLAIYSGPNGGTLTGTATGTPVDGIVTFDNLTLPKSGTYRLVATDGSLIPATSNSFVVSAGAPAAIVFANLPTSTPVNDIMPSVVVNVVDDFGNIVSADASTVTLSILTGVPTVGTISGTTSVVAVNGVATFDDLAINTAGAYTLQVDNGDVGGESDAYIITGAADHVAFLVQPTQTTAKQTITPGIQVAIVDILGHTIVGDTSDITIALSSGAGTLSGTTTVTAIDGIATFSDLSINVAGTAQFTATAGTLTAGTSDVFTLTPAPVALTFGQGPFQVAMNSPMFPGITINVLDENGLTVTNDASAITLAVIGAPKGGTMTGTFTVTAVNGVATFDNLTFTKQGTYTLLAYSGNLVTETSVDFVVTAPAAKLAFVTQPIVTSMAGVTLPAFSIRVTDAKGALVTTDHSNVTITLIAPPGATTSGTIGGTTTVTAINGIATFDDLVLTVAGKFSLKVSDAALTAATSTPITITPNTTPIPDPNSTTGLLINPVMIVSTNPIDVLVGKVLPTITIREEDMYGNLITTVNNGTAQVYILSGPQNTLNGTATAKFVKGIATIKGLTINTAGDYTLRIENDVIIPHTSPYEITATYNQMAIVNTIVNYMRAPSHAANYAFGGPITFNANIGSLVASNGILYTNGTVGESVRLVTISGTTLETGTVAANGAVSFNFNDLAPGTYNVQVIYDGDTNHTGARSPIFSFKVGPTSTNLTLSPTTLNSGATLTLTATVTSVLGNSLLTSGSVQFFEDGSNTPLTTATITGNAHTAVFSFVPTAGTHSYIAKFVANSSLSASTSVTKLATVI